MKTRTTIILAVILIFTFGSLHAQAASEPDGIKPISSFEGGKLFKSGKINILVLQGSYRQMGRQYGHLLSSELKGLYKSAVVNYFQKEKGLSSDSMKKAAMYLYRFYPQRFKDIIIGMAETSGLSLDEQIMLNALEHFGSMSGCSGIIAWGKYTKDKPLVAGRNYDWFDKYADFAKSLTVTVFNPDSGIPNAIVTFTGVIYATTGMNAEGIMLELNNGLPTGGSLSYANRVPAIVNLLAALTDCSSLDQLDAFFNTTRTNFAFIINTADKTTGVSYEWAPFEHRRRNGDPEGLLVSTNHFTDPSWGIAMKDSVGFETVRRRDNLLALADKNKDKIDVVKMKAMLDTPMKNGGATWPVERSERSAYRTVYQIVIVPDSLQMWVKVPAYQEWTAVELKKLFLFRN